MWLLGSGSGKPDDRGGEMTQGPSEAEGRVRALPPRPLIAVASSGMESGQANIYQHVMSQGTFSPVFLLFYRMVFMSIYCSLCLLTSCF